MEIDTPILRILKNRRRQYFAISNDYDKLGIDALKKLGLVSKKADRIKVLDRGTMTKKVTVVADKFSIQAVKMIGLAGGTAQKYKD